MRIVIAISGGVDSSVAAYELLKKGHEVIGLTMRICSEVSRARIAAKNLRISHQVVDISKEFDGIVKKYYAREYSRGRTPNPCIYCNSKIKFGIFFEKMKELGAERFATGHYARLLNKGGEYFLKEAKDKRYDQSYFLCGIPQEKLKFVEFPIGELTKNEVRNIVLEQNFPSAKYKPSQDICFTVDKDKRSGYLPGEILNVSGNVIGKHKGIALYTIGQRKGFGVSAKEPLYVSRIDYLANTITVGTRGDCFRNKIRVKVFNRFFADKFTKPIELEVKIRYNSKKILALVTPLSKDEAIVEFKESQFAPAPGQAAVFYDEEIVVAGAWIEETW